MIWLETKRRGSLSLTITTRQVVLIVPTWWCEMKLRRKWFRSIDRARLIDYSVCVYMRVGDDLIDYLLLNVSNLFIEDWIFEMAEVVWTVWSIALYRNIVSEYIVSGVFLCAWGGFSLLVRLDCLAKWAGIVPLAFIQKGKLECESNKLHSAHSANDVVACI